MADVPWEHWTSEYSFGAQDTPRIESLGNVRDAAFDDAGRLLVLDDLNHRIVVLDAHGIVESAIEGHGVGPGELKSPIAVLPRPGREFLVLDGAQSVLQEFVLDGDSASERRRLHLQFRASDACVVDDRIFVLGFAAGSVIHEIEPGNGAVRQSFGSSVPQESLENADPIELTIMAEAAAGYLHCSLEPARVLHAPERLGWVRAYDVDGRLMWHTRLAEFVEPRRTFTGSGVRYDTDGDAGYASRIRRLSSIGSEIAVVEIEYQWRRGSTESRIPEAVFLDMHSGSELGRRPSVASIIDAGSEKAVTLNPEPYPVIHVWTR